MQIPLNGFALCGKAVMKTRGRMMAKRDVNRRDMMRWSASASALGLLGRKAFAQNPDQIEIFGQKIPSEIAGVKLPLRPLNLVRTIASILTLEQEANRRGLRTSRLTLAQESPLTPNEASFYQQAMPRLVAVIDRSEESDAALADQAGELLAQVHAREHEAQQAQQTEPLLLSRAHDFASLKSEYAALFESAALRADHAETIDWHHKMLLEARPRYEKLGSEVAVPWYFIGMIHGLEASFNFRAHLHNGDFPLTKRTRQVPAGRPLIWLPPSDWESSAKDALKLLGFTNQSDWSLERTLYRLEAYNGFGYRRVRVATPYLWSFSSHYEKGKFVADGRWNPIARSHQCGAATVLKALVSAGDVKFG
jgi:lysozyme family protein